MYQTTEEIINLIKAFESQTLLKNERTHATFLTVGLYYCIRFPFGTAIKKMRNSVYLLNYLHSSLETEKGSYHETLTVFWMITIKQFLETSKIYNLADLANQLIAFCSDGELLFHYYSHTLLASSTAKQHHVSPDLDKFYLLVNVAKLTAHTDGEKKL